MVFRHRSFLVFSFFCCSKGALVYEEPCQRRYIAMVNHPLPRHPFPSRWVLFIVMNQYSRGLYPSSTYIHSK
ncbi:hypothetical protein GGR54DRAFT_537739 [Hypoxylon sp. NC1633]|nr:hypothetical protein GGR54DRAFT_537739 [Hypoxylon sp. NC1633]